MRLRGYVAIELGVGTLLAAVLSAGVLWGVSELQEAAASTEDAPAVAEVSVEPTDAARVASTGTVAARPAVLPVDVNGSEAAGDSDITEQDEDEEPSSLIAATGTGAGTQVGREPFVPALPSHDERDGTFLGVRDDVLLAPLRDGVVKGAKLNRGGTSLSLRLEFDNGARAACKTNQIHLHSQPRREVAAYRINRLLGLSSVPPAIARRLRAADIVNSFRRGAGRDRTRAASEMVAERDGTVVAELSWWIPVLEPAVIQGFEIDTTDGVVTWKRYLTVGREIPADVERMVSQISELVLFDFIINNSDRWSGGNVKTSDDRSVLFFMDNTLSFGDDHDGHTKVRTYLHRAQKFSRRLVNRLRDLELDELRAAVTRDIEPFQFLLDKAELRTVLKRRDYAIRYIDELIAKHGEAAVLVFP